jgi:CheY-like chemotaxis protein
MDLVNSRVLVLDDDKDLRILLRKLLEGAGMRVSEAGDVDEAFTVAMKEVPHVVVSDLNMPGQSGYAFIDRIRRTESLKNVPIVVLSAQNDAASVHRAISLGANDYVLKPFHSAGLTQKIRKALMNKTICRYEFPPESCPPVTVTANCSIVEAGESGYRIEAPIRIAAETQILVKSTLLESMGVSEFPIRTSPRVPMLRKQGQYLNEATSVGLSEASLHRIRSTLRRFGK